MKELASVSTRSRRTYSVMGGLVLTTKEIIVYQKNSFTSLGNFNWKWRHIERYRISLDEIELLTIHYEGFRATIGIKTIKYIGERIIQSYPPFLRPFARLSHKLFAPKDFTQLMFITGKQEEAEEFYQRFLDLQHGMI